MKHVKATELGDHLGCLVITREGKCCIPIRVIVGKADHYDYDGTDWDITAEDLNRNFVRLYSNVYDTCVEVLARRNVTVIPLVGHGRLENGDVWMRPNR
jgi:hypothetical protein